MSNNSKLQMGAGAPGVTGLLKEGFKHISGVEDAVIRNIEACKQMSAITATSFGPNGMNKLVINHLEKILVTSDTATIVKELEVEHPAAKMLCMAADMQENEAGDGTNFVITFGGELLDHATSLLRNGVHISDIVRGYEVAGQKAMSLVEELAVHKLSDLRDPKQLGPVVRTVIGAKHHGFEDWLEPLVTKACISAMPSAPRKPSVNVDNVRVVKMIGMSVADSQLVHGLVVQRSPEGTVHRVDDAKIAVFGCAIEAASTETKGTVVIRSADELKSYNKGEEQRMEESIKSIADTGAKVIVAGGAISEMALHFIEKYGLLAVKIVSKFELRRLCRAVGGTAVSRLGPPTPEELGHASMVAMEELSGRRVTVFRSDEDEGLLSTIVLRGSTTNLLDDVERAIGDAVAVVKNVCKEPRLLPGAGATELEMAHRIQQYADATPGLEQYAIHKFANAFEVFPRILAENSGKRATESISALYAAHAGGNTAAGINVDSHDDITIDAVESGILDSLFVKREALRLSLDAALTVLKVDQIIMAKKAGGPNPRQQRSPDM